MSRKLRVRLGGDNHLAVTLASQVPRVECDSSTVPFNRESCAIIERGMNADGKMLLWGDRHLDIKVEEENPYEM